MNTAKVPVSFEAAARRAIADGVSFHEGYELVVKEGRENLLFTRDGSPFHNEPVMVNGKAYSQVTPRCNRCAGQGGWSGWPGYTCFKCGGRGWLEAKLVSLYTAEEIDRLNAIRAKKEANREAKAAKAAAKAAADLEARKAELRQGEELFRDLEAFAAGNAFLSDILAKWPTSGLTERQREAAATAIARKKEAATEGAKSAYVGNVGERLDFSATIKTMICRDGIYGPSYFHVMADDCGNVLIYSGSVCLGQRGESVSFKASVKDHASREGVAQTVITRPKLS